MPVASVRIMLVGQCYGDSVKHVVFEDLALTIMEDRTWRKRLMIGVEVHHLDLVAKKNFNPHETG